MTAIFFLETVALLAYQVLSTLYDHPEMAVTDIVAAEDLLKIVDRCVLRKAIESVFEKYPQKVVSLSLT